MDKKKILLSIGLLASNRQDTIKKCLDSLNSIRKEIPSELIIIDTGCQEPLHRMLEQYADKVECFTWCNDFSKARNACLKLAEGQWFLYLDDDEWFTDSKEIIDFFKSEEYKHYGYASYIQRNYLDEEGSQYTDSWVQRMIKLQEDTHFESKIHEYFVPKPGNGKNIKSIVDHYGYVYKDEEAKQKHFERNRVLLEEMIELEPREIRWKLQLVQEYRSMDDYANMLQIGEDCLAKEREVYGEIPDIYLGTFYAARVLAYLGMEQYEKAVKACKQILNQQRNTFMAQAFAYFSLARAYFFLGEYSLCVQNAEKYLEVLAVFQRCPENFYEQQIAPFAGECFDEVKKKEIYSLLICSGLKQGRTGELKLYLNQLQWQEDHLYVFEKMAECLIEAMCSMKREQVFIDTLRLMQKNSALWNYLCQEALGYQERGMDITPLVQMAEEAEKPVLSLEMQQLAEQVKTQLSILLGNGMIEQAKGIITQVRKILPEDEELKKMEQELADR